MRASPRPAYPLLTFWLPSSSFIVIVPAGEQRGHPNIREMLDVPLSCPPKCWMSCSVENLSRSNDHCVMCDDPKGDLAALAPIAPRPQRGAEPPLDHRVDRLRLPPLAVLGLQSPGVRSYFVRDGNTIGHCWGCARSRGPRRRSATTARCAPSRSTPPCGPCRRGKRSRRRRCGR